MLSSFGHLSAQKKKLTLKIYFLFLASLLIAIYILEPSLFKPIKPHKIRLQPEKNTIFLMKAAKVLSWQTLSA